MGSAKEELDALEAEVQRIRAKQNNGNRKDTIRKVLNYSFMIGAFIGVCLYFYLPDEDGQRIPALMIIGAAMFLKVMEFILRFTA